MSTSASLWSLFFPKEREENEFYSKQEPNYEAVADDEQSDTTLESFLPHHGQHRRNRSFGCLAMMANIVLFIASIIALQIAYRHGDHERVEEDHLNKDIKKVSLHSMIPFFCIWIREG